MNVFTKNKATFENCMLGDVRKMADYKFPALVPTTKTTIYYHNYSPMKQSSGRALVEYNVQATATRST